MIHIISFPFFYKTINFKIKEKAKGKKEGNHPKNIPQNDLWF